MVNKLHNMSQKSTSDCSSSPQVCGSCMLGIQDLLTRPTNQTSIRKMLYYFCSELDMRIDLKVTLCTGCFDVINSLHKFKQKSVIQNESKFSLNQQTDVSAANIKKEIKMEEIDLSENDSENNQFFRCFQHKSTTVSEVIPQKYVSHSTAIDVKYTQWNFKSNCTNENTENTCSCEKCKLDSEKKFQCNHCNYGTSQKTNLEQHISIHTNETPVKYNQCNSSSKEKSCLNNQICAHTEEKPFKCNTCDFSTNLKKHLVNHNKTHKTALKKLYKCCECDYTTSVISNLKSHNYIHTGEKPFKCRQCDYSCTQKSYIRTHACTHSEEKPFKCNLCSFSSKWKHSLKKHNNTHISATENKNRISIQTDVAEALHKCCHCGYSTSVKSYLTQHLRIHTEEKQFECFDCGYSALRKINLVRHILLHSDLKPFKCVQCNYSTKLKHNLYRHSLIHIDEKRFQCGNCNYRTHHKRILDMHVRIHTGEELFKCSQCSFSSLWNSNLKKHKLIHTKEKS